MEADNVAALVDRELSEFQYAPPAGTMGTPFSREHVVAEIERLRAALVRPHLETVAIGAPDPGPSRKLWVVTRLLDNGYLVVFDSESKRFGLAAAGQASPPETVAVWGGLVSTFMAR